MSQLPWAYQPPPAPAPPAPRPRQSVVRTVVTGAVLLVVFAVLGLVAGWVWHQLWNAPAGESFQGHWYPVRGSTFDTLSTNETAQGQIFSSTGLFMVVTFVGGLVVGIPTGLLLRRAELVVLVVTVVGSALATYLCWRVGVHLSPPDPETVAKGAPDFTAIPADLFVSGRSPYVCWAFGALLGLGGVYLLTSASTREGPLGSYVPPAPGLGDQQTG